MSLRRWIILSLTLVSLLVLLASAVWWRIHAAWQEMLVVAERAEVELAAIEGTRPVLLGAVPPAVANSGAVAPPGGTAGAPAAGYSQVLQPFADLGIAEQLDDDARGVVDWLSEPSTADPICWAAVDRLAPVLDALRQVTRGPDGRLAIDVPAGFSGAGEDVILRRGLFNYLLLHAWREAQASRTGAAVDDLLDAVQCARDHMEDGVAIRALVGSGMMQSVARLFCANISDYEPPRVLAPAFDLNALGPAALRRLGDGLAIVDRPLSPLRRIVQTEAVLLRREVQRMLETGGGLSGALGVVGAPGAWRYAFSMRWMSADAVTTQLAWSRALPGSAADWPTCRAGVAARADVVERTKNPLMRLVGADLLEVAAGRRRGMVNLRMLRWWVSEALGDSQAFDDPFGDPKAGPAGMRLLRKTVDGKTLYWSRGDDGVDDGGDAEKDVVFKR